MLNVKVAQMKDVPPGTSVAAEVEGNNILLANVDGRFYAIDAVCSHMGGNLAKGQFDGRIVTCPRHGAQYDVTTGELVKDVSLAAKALNMGRGAKGQKSFPVSVEGDDIVVTV